jgi:hypothetical protein
VERLWTSTVSPTGVCTARIVTRSKDRLKRIATFPNDVAGAAVALNDPSVLSSHQIYWDKWMRLQKEAALNDMNSYEMDHEYPDYE